VTNDARRQVFQGILWFGPDCNPKVAIVKGQPGDKPITIMSHDLLLHERVYAAYGDKRLFRYGIDTIDVRNRLFFYGMFPMAAESQLAHWLVRKTGDMVSHVGICRMAQFIKQHSIHLENWCYVEDDLFRPENKGYDVYGTPPDEAVKAIIRSATVEAPKLTRAQKSQNRTSVFQSKHFLPG
jgi:hypothetical protein